MHELSDLYYTRPGIHPPHRATGSPDGLPLRHTRDTLAVTDALHDPARYIAEPDLAAAINTAIILGRPLFVTGEPGTGKSELADHIAQRLCLGKALRVEIKSTTRSTDLFYAFDSLRQFRDANLSRLISADPTPGVAPPSAKDQSPRDEARHEPHDPPAAMGSVGADWVRPYLTFQGLGLAILKSRRAEDALIKRYWDARRYGPFDGPRRSVVLIDEIDKAQRDVPNDLLNEVDRHFFHVHEDENRLIGIDNGLAPLIVFTSNAEKHLPTAFLRRCVYHHIRFPDLETEAGMAMLEAIVASRIVSYPIGCRLLGDALALMRELRSSALGLAKPPTTAELLDWLSLLHAMGLGPNDPIKGRDGLRTGLGAILKSLDDRQAAERHVIAEWFPQ
jgi:MoxR-like ATPase